MEFMEKLEMDISGVQIDKTYSTGRTLVSTQTGGHPKYHILPDRAFDHIETDEVSKLVTGKRWSALYYGTLSSRRENSRNTLFTLYKHCFDFLFLSLNLRPPWYSDDIIWKSLTNANWCKISHQELQKISGRRVHTEAQRTKVAKDIIDKYNLNGLLITLGAEGGLCITDKNEQIRNEGEYLDKIVDTVGAGDAFSAVILLGIINNWDLQITLRRAVKFSADFCGWAGAVTHSLSLHKAYIEQWEHE
jgi:fructokinase